MAASLKRLYVGGIGSSVTDAELADRFGKFGKVNGVEIISRKDETGNPVKTFAYLNISISEVDLKKCMSALNKTKWKGGVLQIEIAKESFLHRLSQERQEAKYQTTLKPEQQKDLVQSLKKAGVTDFQMKAAVPGTEVPDHKDWVVSKYGRVLPVLHLKGNNRNKIMKYDPSKFCHNIKKLDDGNLEMTPISNLTWQLEGGDNEISKKRRGEFPVTKSPLQKKAKMQKSIDIKEIQGAMSRNCSALVADQAHKHTAVTIKKREANRQLNSWKKISYDSDSEEELRAILEKEKIELKAGPSHIEDAHLEVVDESFKLSYDTHWGKGKIAAKKNQSNCKTEDEYDSADTDEIISVAKTVKLGSDSEPIGKKNLDSEELKSNQGNNYPHQKGIIDKLDSGGNNDSLSESSDSYSDEEYESMMQNCHRLDLTLEGLAELARTAQEHSENDNVEEEMGNSQDVNIKQEVKISASTLGKNSCTTPDEIVAYLLEGDDGDSSDEQPKEKRAKQLTVKPPAFKGLASLAERSIFQELDISLDSKSKLDIPSVALNSKNSSMGTTIGTGDAKEETGVKINLVHKSKLVDQQNDQCKKLPKTQRKTESEMIKSNITTSSSSDSDDDTSSSEDRSSILPMSVRPSKCLQGPDAKIIEEKSISNKQVTVNEPVSGVLKQQDNAKRLAAMEERRKERELQKQTIQGALLKLDSQPSSKGKHVVFDSDAESDQDYTESKSSEVKSEFKEKEQNKTTKLFGSSEEESDEDDGSTDGKQFQIKSQYEGRSGEKLMHLQSRFGTDERFKMDSRFLDDSSEDEDDEERKKVAQVEKDDLSAEKKKNLDILRSLNINVEQPALSKQASKAKKFKDVNALQYDPSREDHAVFERKAEDDKKESKSQRKKKRIEAEKLPEVSSETYHEVTVDFKEVFGASKPYESTRATWDQEHEIEGVEQEDSTNSENFSFLGQKKDENTGFTFSFFQTAVEETVCNEETYNIKPIKPAKLAWLEDPRFQDSSSDGEENDEPYISKETSRSSETKPSENAMRFLFFVKGDHRLKEGPKMFFRSSNLEKEEEAWQERRDFLLEECRKRHKDAKRKVKAKQ